MSSLKSILVELSSWEKYNPRNDAKAWSWFRMQNDFFEDDDVFELPALQKLLLVYLFTRRNKTATAIFQVKMRHASRHLSCTEAEIHEGLAALVALGKVKVKDDVRERTQTNVNVRSRTDPYPTDVRTYDGDDVTRQDDRTGARPPAGVTVDDFVQVWNTNCGPLDVVADLSPTRIAQVKTCLLERPDLEEWATIIRRLAASAFATGKVPTQRRPNGWRATFAWLIAVAERGTLILAGEYDDRGKPKKKPLKILTAEDIA